MLLCCFPKYSGNVSTGGSHVICIPRDTLWELQFPDAKDGGRSEKCQGARLNSWSCVFVLTILLSFLPRVNWLPALLDQRQSNSYQGMRGLMFSSGGEAGVGDFTFEGWQGRTKLNPEMLTFSIFCRHQSCDLSSSTPPVTVLHFAGVTSEQISLWSEGIFCARRKLICSGLLHIPLTWWAPLSRDVLPSSFFLWLHSKGPDNAEPSFQLLRAFLSVCHHPRNSKRINLQWKL